MYIYHLLHFSTPSTSILLKPLPSYASKALKSIPVTGYNVNARCVHVSPEETPLLFDNDNIRLLCPSSVQSNE